VYAILETKITLRSVFIVQVYFQDRLKHSLRKMVLRFIVTSRYLRKILRCCLVKVILFGHIFKWFINKSGARLCIFKWDENYKSEQWLLCIDQLNSLNLFIYVIFSSFQDTQSTPLFQITINLRLYKFIVIISHLILSYAKLNKTIFAKSKSKAT